MVARNATSDMNSGPSGARPRLVVAGAGFGGLNLVRGLARAPIDIVLIDRHNHHLFQPLLYQVATAALSADDIASPIRALLARQGNVEIRMADMDGVDPQARQVMLRDGAPIGYDWLVIATGSQASWFGHDDWAEHATSLKTLADADRLRARLLAAFEAAENATDAATIRALLTFVVVGGGASGVELAGSIRELADHSLAHDFRRIRPAQARIVLYEGGKTLLAGFPPRLARYAHDRLTRLGVEVHTDTQVAEIGGDGVRVGEAWIGSTNVFWCAGVTAGPAASWLHAPAGHHGTLRVGPDCRVIGHDTIFAIGDVASQDGADGKALPGVAPVAKQQGRYVARVIAAAAAHTAPPGPFRYRDQGSLAIIGRSSAVANLPFATCTGWPAWLLWSGVHLLLLNGLRNRVLVYVQWVSAWLFYARGARVFNQSAPLRSADRSA